MYRTRPRLRLHTRKYEQTGRMLYMGNKYA